VRRLEEVLFRARQEAADLWLLLTKPALPKDSAGTAPLLSDPDWCVDRLRGTEFARDVESIAEGMLAHRFPILGVTIDAGPEIDWRRDYLHAKTSGTRYARHVPYLDFAAVGDHKVVWELNRHQHLVILAQAFRFTGRREFLDEAVRQVRAWNRSNPFMRGINWTSSLEVAFRSLSWTWLYHLAHRWLPPDFRRDLLTGLWRHGLYLFHNLSIYFSPNTHLLGEAVALHALGVLFPSFPRASELAETGRRLVWRQMEDQVRDDGSHYEQSSYYQVYALDFFLFHQTLEDTPVWYRKKLARMADYLDSLMGADRRLPFLGDDDGGRFFHPYGPREAFGRATLATCGRLLGKDRWRFEPRDLEEQAFWWLGERAAGGGSSAAVRCSRRFADAGIAILEGAGQVIVDAGGFGTGTAGHSHSDTLSLVVRHAGEETLVDAGTYCYTGDRNARDWFRGSAAHNTLRIDQLDQATPAGPFRWQEAPEVEALDWQTSAQHDSLDASCRYRGFRHRRRLLFAKVEGLLFVLDEVEGPPGDHLLELFWHPGEVSQTAGPGCFRIGRTALLAVAGPAQAELSRGGEHGWRSATLYERSEAPVILAQVRSAFPAQLATVIDLSGTGASGRAELLSEAGDPVVRWTGAMGAQARFGRHAILDRKC
jgi:hypothetical protein